MSKYNELNGLKVRYLSADPPSPENGQVWYNSTAEKVRVSGVLGTGAWASGGVVGTARNTCAAGTQTANVIMGGQLSNSPSQPTSNVEEYNGSSWSEVNNMPYSASNLGGTGTQTAGLVFGGYLNVTTTAEYDGSSWTGGGAMGTGREVMTGGLGLQNAAFAVGGYRRPSTATTAVEQYDGSSWATVNTRPYGAGSAMGSGTQTAALNYGGNPSGQVATTVKYDGTNWSTEANMANVRSMGGGSPAGTTGAALATTGTPSTATEEFTQPEGIGDIASS